MFKYILLQPVTSKLMVLLLSVKPKPMAICKCAFLKGYLLLYFNYVNYGLKPNERNPGIKFNAGEAVL